MNRDGKDDRSGGVGQASRSGRVERLGESVGIRAPESDFFVFGYGSLMWRPGFPYVSRHGAVIHGLHRKLCVYSFVHRGTPERPGLVLGLDKGGSCKGAAFRVEAKKYDQVISYLREREQSTQIYLEQWRKVRLESGESVIALAYAVDRTHQQYAKRLSHEKMLDIIRSARGISGRNPEYLINTLEHFQEQGIKDPQLEAVVKLIKA